MPKALTRPALAAGLDAQHLGSGDDGIAVMRPHQIGARRIRQVLAERRLVRELDELHFQRVTVVPIDDQVPRQQPTAMVGQERQYIVLEPCDIAGASGVLPQQDAKAQRHAAILPYRTINQLDQRTGSPIRPTAS